MGLLKLQLYRKHSLKLHPVQKLQPCYFGPFKILNKYGKIAYKLDLSAKSSMHPTFHVSQLKKYRGPPSAYDESPLYLQSEEVPKPHAILEWKIAKRSSQAATMVLLHWKDTFPTEVT